MDHNVTLILLILVNFIPSSCLLRRFHYVNLKANWSSAQQYCRAKYTDLAKFRSVEDMSALNRTTVDTSAAWIGLNDDPDSWRGVMGKDANSWRWSATGAASTTGYEAWYSGEPNDRYLEYCVLMNTYGLWNDYPCDSLNSFICYKETAQQARTYVFVSLQLTWPDARTYCRTHFTDLPTIESSADSANVQKPKPYNTDVWIGLYRLPWKWSDGSSSSFENWEVNEPNNYGDDEYCVNENYRHFWNDDNCASSYMFICQEDLTDHMIVVETTIQTSADMTDPAANAQLLQKLGESLRSQGLPYITLQWKTWSRKQENFTEPHCTLTL